MDDVSIVQDPRLLWVFSSLLIVVLGFFIRSWMNRSREDTQEVKADVRREILGVKQDIREVVKKLGCKQDLVVCNDRTLVNQKNADNFYRHKHFLNCDKDETGGVMIP